MAVFLTPSGQIYMAAGAGNANDSQIGVTSATAAFPGGVSAELTTALTSAGATTRGAAIAEVTGRGSASELRKSNNFNH